MVLLIKKCCSRVVSKKSTLAGQACISFTDQAMAKGCMVPPKYLFRSSVVACISCKQSAGMLGEWPKRHHWAALQHHWTEATSQERSHSHLEWKHTGRSNKEQAWARLDLPAWRQADVDSVVASKPWLAVCTCQDEESKVWSQ